MRATIPTPWRRVFMLVVSGAIVTIACSGDAPYTPLKDKDAPRAAIVGGTVRDNEHNPIEGAVVTLETAQDGVSATTKWMLEHAGATSKDAPGRRVTVTSPAGRYAFGDVGGGEYVLQVLADDHLGAVRSFNVPAAVTDTIIVDVDLTPTGSFTGNVLLENASSHANTIVYVQGTSYVGVTDPAAGYTIYDVPVGAYTVRATHPGYHDDTRGGTITSAGEVVILTDMTLLIDRNIPPTAVAAMPALECELNPVSMSGTGSDVDGTIVLYEWDFDDDGVADYKNPASASTTHLYTFGPHRAKLSVTDDKGGIGHAVVDFTVLKAETVFVSMSLGNDAYPGTRTLPKGTIAVGLQAAVADTVGLCPATVLVEAGDYFESPVFIPDMIVRGGYDYLTWTHSPGMMSFLEMNDPAFAMNINRATIVSGFEFRAPPGQDGGTAQQRNSVALRAVSSNELKFEDCRFMGRISAAGPSGTSGSPGGNGGAGAISPGGAGGIPGGFVGGAGGGSSSPGQNGGGGCGIGGADGADGGCGCAAPRGEWGFDGSGGPACSGTHGANGAAQNAHGIAGIEWTPLNGFAGLNGTPGKGGGGGGGQGASYPTPGCPTPCGPEPGGAGGGGGGGGGYGMGGGPGEGGGASFAVYLFNSSPVFVSCAFTAGDGGNGGAGGNGGSGGAGGLGSLGQDIAPFGGDPEGGNGGDGGAGGNGGAGSGGPGGPSYCVYRAGTSNPTLTGSTYTLGLGGTGGAGGTRPGGPTAPAGPNGPAGAVGP